MKWPWSKKEETLEEMKENFRQERLESGFKWFHYHKKQLEKEPYWTERHLHMMGTFLENAINACLGYEVKKHIHMEWIDY
jgi:hypothetical protein